MHNILVCDVQNRGLGCSMIAWPIQVQGLSAYLIRMLSNQWIWCFFHGSIARCQMERSKSDFGISFNLNHQSHQYVLLYLPSLWISIQIAFIIELKLIGFKMTTCPFSSNVEVMVTRLFYLAYMQKMKGFHFDKSMNQNVPLWPHFNLGQNKQFLMSTSYSV